MARWRFGDRVRVGSTRGGIVLPASFEKSRPLDGPRLLAFFPNGAVCFLDHASVDDGPDGPIFPDEWEACYTCGTPSPRDICVNCSEDVRPSAGPHVFSSDDAKIEHWSQIFQRLPKWAQDRMRA